MIMHFRLLFAFTSVLAAGCMAGVATKDERAAIKSVALVLIVPNEVTAKYVGVTVFNNEFYTAEVRQQDLRAVVRERATHALAQDCRWGLRNSGLDDSKLWAPYRDNVTKGAFSPNMYTSAESILTPVKAELAAALKSSGADALVVLAPAYGAEPNSVYGDVSGVEGAFNTGIGFHKRAGFNPFQVFVWMEAYLHRGDGADIRTLGKVRGTATIDDMEFKEEWRAFSEAQQQMIVDGIRKLIDQSVPAMCAGTQ